jgi:hypothetical protein
MILTKMFDGQYEVLTNLRLSDSDINYLKIYGMKVELKLESPKVYSISWFPDCPHGGLITDDESCEDFHKRTGNK